MNIDFKILTGGSCGQIEKLTNLKKPFRHIQFPAHFYLIQHETKGNILIDTGYSDHFSIETNEFPYSLYAKATPIQYKSEDSAQNQLKNMGIEKEDISYVFITHFHADHVSGLRDFPNATFICSKVAFEFLKNKQGIAALKHAFVPSFLPDDFEKRAMFIEELPLSLDDQNENFHLLSQDGRLYDIFGDGSLVSMSLPGHAIGQFGLFFETNNQNVWIIADSTWDSDAFRYVQMPSKVSKLIMHDFNAFKETLYHIHHYHKKHPNTFIIPSHCREGKAIWEGEK